MHVYLILNRSNSPFYLPLDLIKDRDMEANQLRHTCPLTRPPAPCWSFVKCDHMSLFDSSPCPSQKSFPVIEVANLRSPLPIFYASRGPPPAMHRPTRRSFAMYPFEPSR